MPFDDLYTKNISHGTVFWIYGHQTESLGALVSLLHVLVVITWWWWWWWWWWWRRRRWRRWWWWWWWWWWWPWQWQWQLQWQWLWWWLDRWTDTAGTLVAWYLLGYNKSSTSKNYLRQCCIIYDKSCIDCPWSWPLATPWEASMWLHELCC